MNKMTLLHLMPMLKLSSNKFHKSVFFAQNTVIGYHRESLLLLFKKLLNFFLGYSRCPKILINDLMSLQDLKFSRDFCVSGT